MSEDYEWVLEESVQVTIINPGNMAGEMFEVLIARLNRPGAVVLSTDDDGKMFTNGEFVDVGDDFPRYWGLFDQIMLGPVGHKGEYTPQVGESFVIDEDNRERNDPPLMDWAIEMSVEARRAVGRGAEAKDVASVLRDLAYAIDGGDVAENTSPILP